MAGRFVQWPKCMQLHACMLQAGSSAAQGNTPCERRIDDTVLEVELLQGLEQRVSALEGRHDVVSAAARAPCGSTWEAERALTIPCMRSASHAGPWHEFRGAAKHGGSTQQVPQKGAIGAIAAERMTHRFVAMDKIYNGPKTLSSSAAAYRETLKV